MIQVALSGLQLLPEAAARLGGHGVAVAVDVLGLESEPPMLKAAIDAKGHASLAFAQRYPAMEPPFAEKIRQVLASAAAGGDGGEIDESEIQLVVFRLDAPLPHGEPEEEIGMASVSLRKLLTRGRDHAESPLRLLGIEGERLGTITGAVTALRALQALTSGAAGAAASQQPQSFTFGPGPLGLQLLDREGGVTISVVEQGGQGASQGVRPNSVIVGLNGEPLTPGLTREGLVNLIRQSSRPLTLETVPAAAAPPVRGIATPGGAAAVVAPVSQPSLSQPAASEQPASQPMPVADPKLQALLDMGFLESRASAALAACGGDEGAALDRLLAE